MFVYGFSLFVGPPMAFKNAHRYVLRARSVRHSVSQKFKGPTERNSRLGILNSKYIF